MCVFTQSFLTLCDRMDCSPSGFSVHGIFQARISEWVAISYSRLSSPPRDWTCISCVSCIGRQVLYHCATWEAPRDGGRQISLVTLFLRSVCAMCMCTCVCVCMLKHSIHSCTHTTSHLISVDTWKVTAIFFSCVLKRHCFHNSLFEKTTRWTCLGLVIEVDSRWKYRGHEIIYKI